MSRAAEGMARDQFQNYGIHGGTVGMYGHPPADLAFILVAGPGPAIDHNAVLQGLRSVGGVSANVVEKTVSGLPMTCATVTASGQSGTMCIWSDNGIIGVGIGVAHTDLDDVASLSAEAATALAA